MNQEKVLIRGFSLRFRGHKRGKRVLGRETAHLNLVSRQAQPLIAVGRGDQGPREGGLRSLGLVFLEIEVPHINLLALMVLKLRHKSLRACLVQVQWRMSNVGIFDRVLTREMLKRLRIRRVLASDAPQRSEEGFGSSDHDRSILILGPFRAHPLGCHHLCAGCNSEIGAVRSRLLVTGPSGCHDLHLGLLSSLSLIDGLFEDSVVLHDLSMHLGDRLLIGRLGGLRSLRPLEGRWLHVDGDLERGHLSLDASACRIEAGEGLAEALSGIGTHLDDSSGPLLSLIELVDLRVLVLQAVPYGQALLHISRARDLVCEVPWAIRRRRLRVLSVQQVGEVRAHGLAKARELLLLDSRVVGLRFHWRFALLLQFLQSANS